jgi:glutamyl-tRNA reductase
MATQAGIRPTELAGIAYAPRNCDAARQLFRVTSGLESMIVGENEVQGQVKRAYEAALEVGTSGPLTNRLFTAALQTGKRVRAETGLAGSRVSTSSVAVDLARSAVGDLRDREVLIIGAGETSELTAIALAERGVRTIHVANRHRDRAYSVAERVGGRVVGLDALPHELRTADIVVSSTSSPHPIVGAEELAAVVEMRDQPLLLIDLAVPRDIESDCAELDGVTLYDMDDLQEVVAGNLRVRESEREAADAIVEDEIKRFAGWLGHLEVRPTIAALRRHGDEIAELVVAENAGRWESASPRDLARIDAMSKAIVSRLLHEPTMRLKSSAGHGRMKALVELFGLDDAAVDPDPEPVEETTPHPAPK